MKILVCGGRDYVNRDVMRAVLSFFPRETVIVHGGARGADKLCGSTAKELGFKDVRVYPADWKAHGKAAGPIRNREMYQAERPDIVVAFPGGNGTADMIGVALNGGTRVIEVPF